MAVLVTGAAGFIGYHVSLRLLARGDEVVGLDDLDPCYSVALKRARLARLAARPGFRFREAGLAAAADAVAGDGPVRRVVHLAAHAGVRRSLDEPLAYVDANVAGHLSVLELCRRLPAFEHLVYASSSSVYGDGAALPAAEADAARRPASPYAATKLAAEHLSYSYSHVHGLPQTGLRFFTAYGPWGRPDMALYLFAEAILEDRPIRVFNHGDMARDFTYADDAAAAVVAALDNPPPAGGGPPHRLYNVGSGRSEPLERMIALLEEALGREARRIRAPMQPGDVKETRADISAIRADLGYEPATMIDDGIPRFAAWLRAYRRR